jgi:DNA transformation protein
MAVRPQILSYLLEQLGALPGLRSRRMFSGVGLYSGDLFFALIHDDTLYFKTDAVSSADYVARNMPRFMPFPHRPKAILAYHQVPADVIEDAETLNAWARKAVAVALAAPKPKAKSRARAKSKKKAPPRRTKRR